MRLRGGHGLLVAQSIDGVETSFVWDQALAIPQILATSDGVKTFYGLERLGVLEGGAWHYPQHDALGSVRQWTDATGAVLAMQSYSPFGVPRATLAVAPWGFTGEWHDPGGLVYLRARWYNPSWGRFTQVDPLSGFLGAPATQHPYAYVFNNPLSLIDPSGLGPGDVLRDLFTLPTRMLEEYESTHCDLSVWEHLQNVDFWEVVLVYTAYALVPVVAIEVVPLALLPLNLSGAWGGVAVLAAVGGTAAGGWAALNVLTGEKWYRGVGLAALTAMGTVWARAGAGLETQVTATQSGTVWDLIEPTGPAREGTAVPESFILRSGNRSFIVVPNATKHFQEYITRVPKHGAPLSPDSMPLRSQAMLASFEAAVRAATQNGITYGDLVYVGGWELMFDLPRPGQWLPVIYHALYR